MIQSALLVIGLFAALVAILVALAAIEMLKRRGSNIEPNRGGPISYRYGDIVKVTYDGHLAKGEFKGVGPRIPGQPDFRRMCAIRAEWVDEAGQRHGDDIAVPYWRIRGKVRQNRKQSVTWDTGKYLAQEKKWLLWGPEKEHRDE